jgi:tetratricopeptide (TPR) repeat protein
MEAQAHFSPHSLAETFRDLYLAERTGVLRLGVDDQEVRVHFSRGLIEHVESSRAEHDLGQFLLGRAKISAGAVDEARRGLEPRSSLARALLNRGLISRRDLQDSIALLADEVVRGLFAGASGGELEFEPQERVDELLESDVLSTFRLILHGIDGMADFAPVLDAMRAFDNVLAVRRPSPVPLDKLTLTGTQGFVLSRIDGRTCFRDVISTLPPEQEQVASRFLFGLLVMGVAEYRPPLAEGPFRVANVLRDHADRCALERMQEKTIRQAYARMRKQNPHEILGVTHAASRNAVEKAYAEAKVLFARDRVLPRVRERFKTELGVIESRLVEAYLQLTRAKAAEPAAREAPRGPAQDIHADDLLMRPELDKTRSRTEAEETAKVAELYYGKARKAMLSGDYHNAIQYGKLAISYSSQDARLYALLADCQARNPEARWQRMAEQNYTKATQLDPWNAEYWVNLGRFYKRRGLSLRARRQFEEALKIVPEHEEATKELETLS